MIRMVLKRTKKTEVILGWPEHDMARGDVELVTSGIRVLFTDNGKAKDWNVAIWTTLSEKEKDRKEIEVGLLGEKELREEAKP